MPQMPTISTRIPQDMADFINNQILEGKYHNTSDYVYRLILTDMLQDKFTKQIYEIVETIIDKRFYTPEHEAFVKKMINEYMKAQS